MKHFFILFFALVSFVSIAQTTFIEGYIYEQGNRGYVAGVDITAENLANDKMIGKTFTNEDGFFSVEVPHNSNIRIYGAKEMFDVKKIDVTVEDKKVFVKLEIGRSPGYTFEVTLAEKRASEDIIVDAIKGARIEVYNNTKRVSVMDLKEHMSPEFQLNLEKGNHYTILVRKNGYLSKRMEAKVNVEGCILCFEGVGRVDPGVSDNLTEGNAFGVLLANVELEKIFEGKKMEVQNLLYDTNKWKLKNQAKQELNKVITLLKDNPNLTLELGSHTDARGKAEPNMTLSQKRAKSAVDYLIDKGGIAKSRIVSRGYGELLIKNKCLDGIKCSDKEHAENRRTELKITGITNMAEVKSLERMKKEEQMEAEILQLMDQDEVKVNSDEDLEKLMKENVIQNKEASKEKEEPIKKETAKERIKRERDSLRAKQAKYKGPTKEDLKSEEEQSKPVKREDAQLKIIGDIPGLEVVEKPNGTKVIISQGSMPLPSRHPIFKKNDKLELYRNENDIIYYMVPFENKEDAISFYKTPEAKKYRGAFIAEFTNGVMTKIKP